MTIWGLYICTNCQAGETCRYDDVHLGQLYTTEELAREALKYWAESYPGCYKEDDEVTCYYDHCTCDDNYITPCTYQEYLKAGTWAGVTRAFIKEVEVKESL